MQKLVVVLLLCLCFTQENVARTTTATSADSRSSRDAFTVKFDFAGKKVEQKFDTTPYVDGKTITIFPSEEVGFSVKQDGNGISEIRYEPDLKKANVTLKLEVQDLGSRAMMMLTTTNGLIRA